MAVSGGWVVAVAAVLQNSVVGILCEASGRARDSPDTYVAGPFFSGPDVLVLSEKDQGLFLKDHGLFKKGPDVFCRCRNPPPFQISAPVFAPARPCADIIMCVSFPTSGGCLKNMSYNISYYQHVTNVFPKR